MNTDVSRRFVANTDSQGWTVGYFRGVPLSNGTETVTLSCDTSGWQIKQGETILLSALDVFDLCKWLNESGYAPSPEQPGC